MHRDGKSFFVLLAAILLISAVCPGCATLNKSNPGSVQEFCYTMPLGAEEIPPLNIPAKEPPEPQHTETQPTIALGTAQGDSHAEQERWGYRIQIYSTMQQDEAEQKAADARARLNEKVFVEFDPPYYKVRVGNCKNADEAEILLDKVKRTGYPDAWIVRARVIWE